MGNWMVTFQTVFSHCNFPNLYRKNIRMAKCILVLFSVCFHYLVHSSNVHSDQRIMSSGINFFKLTFVIGELNLCKGEL